MLPDRVYLSKPHMSGQEMKFIEEAFNTNWIAPLGPNVDKFETEVANYVGAKGALALNSGTSAIHLALKLLNVNPGDVIFCSSLTFIASANPIVYEGAKPVFIDSEEETWNMSPKALERALEKYKEMNKLPKAVIIVNLYGQSANYDSLVALCNQYGVPIIEDAAESLGATYNGKMSGSIGKFGVFSFNGNKIITTSGGGMLVSDDTELIEKGRFYSTQAREKAVHYQHEKIGYNYRLSNVLAGIGIAQMAVLEDRINSRRAIFDKYYEALSGYEGIKFMPEGEFGRHTRWLTTLTIDEEVVGVSSRKIIEILETKNIESRPVWKPLHIQPVFEGHDYFSHDSNVNVCEKLFNQGICLPSASNMTDKEQEIVIEILTSIIDKARLKAIKR